MDIVTHIVLTGICLFTLGNVPQAGDSAVAVLPELSGAHEPHIAVLLFLRSSYAATSHPERIDTLPRSIDPQELYYVVYLHGEVIKPELGAGAFAPVRTQPATPSTPTPAVPHLRLVAPHAAEIDETYFATPLDSDLVAARLPMTVGTFQTRYVESDLWEFRPGRTVKQSLAQEVELVNVVRDQLTLELTDGGTQEAQTLSLTLKPGGDGEITLILANAPAGDILPRPRPGEASDPHFRLYFDMLVIPPARRPIPYKLSEGQPIGLYVQRVGGANCGPTQYP